MAIDLNDKTSNGNNLTNVNTATEVTTSLPFAQSTIAVDLASASSQYLTANDSASLSLSNAHTLELWVKFTSLPSSGNNMAFIGKMESGATTYSYLFRLQNNGGTYELHHFISDDGTDLQETQVTWSTPSTGTWYHVAVTFSSGTTKFYVDGSQVGTNQTNGNTTISDSNSKLSIGAWNTTGTPSDLLNAKIDDVRIWSVVRTATEIANNRSVELVGNESNLVAYYPFEATLGGSNTGGFLQFM